MSGLLEIEGEKYSPVKTVAKRIGYSSDYIGRLAREKKIDARKIGNQWFVSEVSLQSFLAKNKKIKKMRSVELSAERKNEISNISRRAGYTLKKSPKNIFYTQPAAVRVAVLQTYLIMFLGVSVGIGGYTGIENGGIQKVSTQIDRCKEECNLSSVIFTDISFFKDFAISLYTFISPPAVESVDTIKIVVTDDFQIKERKLVTLENRPMTLNAHQEDSKIIIDIDDPTSLSDEEVTRLIQDSFSDKIYIEREDANSGMIIPRFRNGDGEAREFLIVSNRNETS